MRIKISGGRVCDPLSGQIEEKDIYIEKGVFTLQLSGDPDQVIDAAGLHVIPGLIDAHCHLREPGFEYREDIESGTKSAAKGGFNTVTSMPNTMPVCDNAAIVSAIISKAKQKGSARVLPIGAASKGQKGQELAEIGLMAEAGIVAVSDDGRPVESSDMMKKTMLYAAQFKLPVISHCEDLSLAADGHMNEGLVSTMMGLRGIPSVAESAVVARDCLLAEYLNLPLHIAHVSCRASVEQIRQAKKRGVPVTSETCPHYFTLTDEACQGFNTMAKMNPPLQTADDRQAVIDGLIDGTIDLIATDHAPHHRDEKEIEFALANNGITGLETAFGLGFQYLVEPGHLTLIDWIRKMTIRPAEILGQKLGSFEAGRPADVTLADLNASYTFCADDMASKARNTPYDGWQLKGRVVMTLLEGKTTYSWYDEKDSDVGKKAASEALDAESEDA